MNQVNTTTTSSVLSKADFSLRPYQSNAVSSVLRDWQEFDRVLGVASTGAGKTIIFSRITKHVVENGGRVLILAHRDELLDQAIQKLYSSTGILADKEKAEEKARLSAKVVVGSIQTLIGAARRSRFSPDHFDRIIVDEAHHVLADSYQNVLGHFTGKVLGVTATADRSDKKSLGSYFEKVSFEITLLELIREGFLVPIVQRQIPIRIDLSGVRRTAGDFNAADLDDAIEPWLDKVGDSILEHASDRKTVVFLPLVRTAKKFAEIMNAKGIKADWVSGESTDRKEKLSAFDKGEYQLLSNSMLLTEGWDCPSVSCVICLRPTQSRGLYTQIIGRGTRLSPETGKKDLLVLDYLWHAGKHSLIKPVHLLAGSQEEADRMQRIADREAQGFLDLGKLKDLAQEEREEEIREAHQRELSLKRQLEKQAKKQARTFDPVEFALSLHDQALEEYEPISQWEMAPMTENQKAVLEKAGIDTSMVKGKGHATKLIDVLFSRRKLGLATPKQLKFLIKFGYPKPHAATFEEASRFLDSKFSK